MTPSRLRGLLWSVACCACFAQFAPEIRAEEKVPLRSVKKGRTSDRPLLTPEEWRRLDQAVDRGLDFISKNQDSDGSFQTITAGQPAITSLGVMAMLSRGHQPGKGPYGAQIDKGIDFVLSIQDPESGAIMKSPHADSEWPYWVPGHYHHGISGIMLGEVYGMAKGERQERIRKAVIKALGYTRKIQLRYKRIPEERGGWRYVHPRPQDSDLSVTAWQLMFLRSARNAEFNVPQQWMQEALGFVHRAWDPDAGTFKYTVYNNRRFTRAMAGAGVVCLELGGEHGTAIAREAGDWILHHSFAHYNEMRGDADRYYHYGAFYCTQAMFQLGGEHWHRFFPELLTVLAQAQHDDGSWETESGVDTDYGNVYTTALAVLALATPYQILPIYQR
jgi:hypothetical protein